MEPFWQLLIALASTGTLAATVHLARDIVRKRASRKIDAGYGSIQRVYAVIQELFAASKGSRVLVLKSENGGGIPVPGSAVKNSVIFEFCDRDLRPIQRSWQAVPLDCAYSELLSVVNEQGLRVEIVSTIDTNSVLYDLLVASGAERALFLRICAMPSALIYLAVSYPDDSGIDEYERVRCRRAAQELRIIFSEHHCLAKTESEE